jgi:hypothetical protein
MMSKLNFEKIDVGYKRADQFLFFFFQKNRPKYLMADPHHLSLCASFVITFIIWSSKVMLPLLHGRELLMAVTQSISYSAGEEEEEVGG